MSRTYTTRHLFAVAYSYARNIGQQMAERGEVPTALIVAERAIDALIENLGVHWQQVLDPQAHRNGTSVYDAVLWAWHWRHGAASSEKPRLWASERRYGFVLNTIESGKPNEFWWERPALP